MWSRRIDGGGWRLETGGWRLVGDGWIRKVGEQLLVAEGGEGRDIPAEKARKLSSAFGREAMCVRRSGEMLRAVP